MTPERYYLSDSLVQVSVYSHQVSSDGPALLSDGSCYDLSSSGSPTTVLDDIKNVSSKCTVLVSHELMDATLAVDNDTIINSLFSTMSAVTVTFYSETSQ